MKYVFTLIILIVISCGDAETDSGKPVKDAAPGYVNLGGKNFNFSGSYYVPIYSNIYGESGENATYLAATLSIRNISFGDTLYVSKVDYYGSKGELITGYLPQPILLLPMSSVDFSVERDERKGGVGANFIVECRGNNVINEPLIQSVMAARSARVAFAVNAIKIKK